MHDWFVSLFLSGQGPANAVVVITTVAVLGLMVGETRLGPVRLGIAGPLFVGLLLGHFGLRINPELREFAQDLGLILFVYSIGVTVGPGFFQAFRRDGAVLNALAASIVAMGALIAVGLHRFIGLPLEVVVGLFSGGTTNTPSLAAGTQMLAALHATAAQRAAPGLGYAVAYPFGVVGILLTLSILRWVFRLSPQKEAEKWAETQQQAEPLATMNIEVRKDGQDGIRVSDIPGPQQLGATISRVLRGGVQQIVNTNDMLLDGDIVLAVGPQEKLATLRDLLGVESPVQLAPMESPLRALRLVVTRRQVLGRTLAELRLLSVHHVTVTRLVRAGVELVPDGRAKLNFGDSVMCVGEEQNLKAVIALLGNESSVLQFPQIIPIFLGLCLGALLGNVPLPVPGLPASISLGLAGGPVVAAIILSRIGRIGPLVWYMAPGSAHTLREIGVTIFMSCVGVNAGQGFVATLVNGDGALWLACGAILTFVPIFLVGLVGCGILKLNFLTVCGVLAGSMTDPPALAYASALTPSAAQATAYAAVYPLTMCLRILAPQLLLALLWAVAT